jgi:hypothetical protein
MRTVRKKGQWLLVCTKLLSLRNVRKNRIKSLALWYKGYSLDYCILSTVSKNGLPLFVARGNFAHVAQEKCLLAVYATLSTSLTERTKIK